MRDVSTECCAVHRKVILLTAGGENVIPEKVISKLGGAPLG